MNVTPMLDVLLVLLVIFMLVATRTRRTITAQLPAPRPAPCKASEATSLVLEVLPGPVYRLNCAAGSARDSTIAEDVHAVAHGTEQAERDGAPVDVRSPSRLRRRIASGLPRAARATRR